MTKRAQNPRLRMAIKADKDVQFGIMSDVMRSCRRRTRRDSIW